MPTTEKVIEAVDVVDDIQELAEVKVSWLIQNPRVLIASALLTGIAIGSAATYLVAKKRLAIKYQTLADQQVEDVKAHYSVIKKDGASLEDLAAKYKDEENTEELAGKMDTILKDQGYIQYNQVEPTSEAPASPMAEEVITRNVFESDDPDTYFDFDEEMTRRMDPTKAGQPYVITKEEFDLNESEFDQGTLTYYDGDDTLTDDKDTPCEVDATIGYENLLRFGHGSGDPNVVYISNPKLELDFEVVHSDGQFSVEVLGFNKSELKHSDKRPQRKFRDSDE